jgi:hypothetical protein
MTDPWDSDFSGPSFDVDGLLAPFGPLRASETDVEPVLFPLFALGGAAAGAHAAGMIHNDLHLGNVNLSHLVKLHIFDYDSFVFTPLNPRAMAAEFLAPAGSLGLCELTTFVAGYVKASYVINDAIYPNYTEELLSVLGAVLVSAPVPRASLIDLSSFLLRLGLTLVGGRLSVQGDTQLPDVASRVSARVLLTLVLLGADASLLEERYFGAANRSPGDPRAGILVKLWDQAMAEHDAAFESLVKYAGARAGTFAQLDTNEVGLLQPNKVIPRLLGDIREVASDEDREDIADVVVDILCSISRHYDTMEPNTSLARMRSLHFFQMAVIVYQAVVGAPAREEAKLGYLERVLRSFSWFTAWLRGVGASPDPMDTDARSTLSARDAIHVLTCADSLALLLSKQFAVSCKAAAGHPLLSHLMRAIELSRMEFRLCAELLQPRLASEDDDPAPDSIGMVISIMPHLCVRHGKLLQQFVDFSEERCPAFLSLVFADTQTETDELPAETFSLELEATVRLFHSVKAGSPPDLDAVRQHLDELEPYWRSAAL